MRRVLLLVTDLQIGGTPTVVRELAIRLAREPGVSVHVACLAEWGPVAGAIAAAGVDVTALGARSATDFGVVGRLAKLVRGFAPDTLVSFLIHANAAAAAAALLERDVRLIQSIQTTQPWPAWHWRLQGWIAPLCERILVPSPSVAQAAREWSGIPASKIVVIPNAVEVKDFQGLGAVAADARPFPIGFIGRLDPVKRIGDLLEAMVPLGGLVHLHVFGEGPQRAGIEEQILQLGLGARVTLHGAVAHPRQALAQIGLLVLASEAEGFGLVLIEAMAAGVPVVASDVAGIRDVVSDQLTGVLVPPRMPQRLSQAIARLARAPDLRRDLVERARREVALRFSWEAVWPKYRALLAEA